MKFSLLRTNLKQALKMAVGMISTRPTLPIINNVLIEAREGNVYISSTNLDLGFSTSLKAKVEREGSTTVSARLLQEFVSTIMADKIDFELVDTVLKAQAGDYKIKLNTLDPSEFPEPPTLKKEKKVVLPVESLQKVIPMIIFSASTDEARPNITGIYIRIDGDKMTMAAADGYRLAEYQISLSTKKTDSIELIIPAKAVDEVLKLIGYEEEQKEIAVMYDKNQVFFEMGNSRIISRLIVGKFPDYQQIFPEKYTTTIYIYRQELQNAVRLASLFAKETANVVHFIYRNQENTLMVKAASGQIGENESLLQVEGQGEENAISFNAKYVLDLLSVCQTKKVMMQLISPVTPGALVPFEEKKDQDGQEDEYTYVIMPVRSTT